MIIVSDTSPITNLAAIGQLDLLRQLYSQVIIPQAVYNEQQLNLFDTFAQEAAENFMSLIKASTLDNLEKLRQEIEKYPGEPSGEAKVR